MKGITFVKWCTAIIVLILVVPAGAYSYRNGEKTMFVWVEDSINRIGKYDEVVQQNSIHLYSARNEWEAFQLIVSSRGKNLEIINISTGDLINKYNENEKIPAENIHLYREYYVYVSKSSPFSPYPSGNFPDALIPFRNPYNGEELNGSVYDAIPFNLPDGENQPIWVDIFVPQEARAGDYTGNMDVWSSDGQHEKVDIKLTIWNFTISSTPSLKSFFPASRKNMEDYYNIFNQNKLFGLERKYADMLIEHHLMEDTPTDTYPDIDIDTGELNFNIYYEGLGKASDNLMHYMENGMNAYQIPLWEGEWPYEDPLHSQRDVAKKYVENYAHYLFTHGIDEVYVYPIDEPNSAEEYKKVREWGDFFNEIEADSGIKVKLLITEQPVPDNPSWGSLIGYVDIWCPLASQFWRDENYYNTHVISSCISSGDEAWCYTALVQPSYEWWEMNNWPSVLNKNYPPVWLIDYPPINYRIYPWLYNVYNITGMLYWETCYWELAINPWNNPITFVSDGEPFNGDGMLIYPGRRDEMGFDGPIASMRLKWIRDGLEDYEYIKMLRERNESVAMELVHKVARNMADWEINPAILCEVRNEMGSLLDNTFYSLSIEITKPKEGHLYIFDREIMPSYKTIILGGITVTTNIHGIVNKVEFYVDDSLKYTDYTAPYSWLWDERIRGGHEIKVIAYDTQGNEGDDEMNVFVINL